MSSTRNGHDLPASELNRRKFVIGSAGLSAAALLGLRSGASGAQEDSPEATPTVPNGLQPDGAWVFTDDRGMVISTNGVPTKIVAETTAAALWDLGVKPVGVVGPTVLADGSNDFQAGSIDFSEVEQLGDYGEYDIEKLVSLAPDLIIDMSLYGTRLWYLESVVDIVEKVAPTLGISMQSNSILKSIERFEELAVAIGAGLGTPEVASARAEFDLAEAGFKAAIAEKPGLTVLVCSPGTDNVYIASPDWMTDLAYFRDLGLDILTHTT